jgi:nucleoside-diphosphate-sugar epimerase
MKFLVTGATGFIGKSLSKALFQQGHSVCAAVRSTNALTERAEVVVVGEIGNNTDWTSALRDVDVVIHLAARVHIIQESANDPLLEFRKVNVVGTQRLAESAAYVGIRRFVYVSSIGVNGSQSSLPFTELDKSNPLNAYALSKWEAEQVLSQIANRTGLEVVVVRPPLVYGSGAPGNFAQMIKVLAKHIPLPFASVQNFRSLIYVENLADALILCATHPAAVGQTYLVSDGEDVSTPELLRRLGDAMGHPVRLFYCPPALLRLAGKLIGKSDQIDRLLGSLQVDNSKIRRELAWQPPFTLDESLKVTITSNIL